MLVSTPFVAMLPPKYKTVFCPCSTLLIHCSFVPDTKRFVDPPTDHDPPKTLLLKDALLVDGELPLLHWQICVGKSRFEGEIITLLKNRQSNLQPKHGVDPNGRDFSRRISAFQRGKSCRLGGSGLGLGLAPESQRLHLLLQQQLWRRLDGQQSAGDKQDREPLPYPAGRRETTNSFDSPWRWRCGATAR